MLNISIKTIPDDHQRYNTVGDYYVDEHSTRNIIVSDMKDWRFEFLTAVHELVESALCAHNGVTDEMIDTFDFEYEKDRDQSDSSSEPGDDPKAPYYNQHQFASKIEKMVAAELGVDWDQYTELCRKLTNNREVI